MRKQPILLNVVSIVESQICCSVWIRFRHCVLLLYEDPDFIREHFSDVNGIFSLLSPNLLERNLGRFTHVRDEIVAPEIYKENSPSNATAKLNK